MQVCPWNVTSIPNKYQAPFNNSYRAATPFKIIAINQNSQLETFQSLKVIQIFILVQNESSN